MRCLDISQERVKGRKRLAPISYYWNKHPSHQANILLLQKKICNVLREYLHFFRHELHDNKLYPIHWMKVISTSSDNLLPPSTLLVCSFFSAFFKTSIALFLKNHQIHNTTRQNVCIYLGFLQNLVHFFLR